MKELKFDAIVRFPRLEINGKYDLIFNLFGLRLSGKGKIKLTAKKATKKLILNLNQGDSSTIIDNSRGRITMRALKYFANGAEYLKFDKFKIKIQVGDIKHAYLSNLFDGARSPLLQEIAINLIRNQPEFLISEIYPPIEENLSQTFTSIANKLAISSTFDELFPL